MKEINRLRKEMNRLLSKEMQNIYLADTIEEKNHVSFGELQLTKLL